MKKIILCLILLTFIKISGNSQVKPVLGAAARFTVLAGTGVTNAGNTEVDGNLGVAPGNSLTGFPPGTIRGGTHLANTTATTAQTNLTNAYNSAAAQVATQNLTGQNLGGKTLKPGVYKFNGNAALTGALTLETNGDPEEIFIFQVDGNLLVDNSATVDFLELAKPRIGNIFWQVNGSVTIGAGSFFRGTIMANQTINMGTGATIQGRLLSRSSNVNLINNIITIPTDLAVTKTKSPGIKAPELYSVGENITFTITARNLGPLDRTNVRVNDVLPSGLTYLSSTTTSGTAYDPLTSLWVINNLPVGATETLTIVTRINTSPSDFIVNSATIAGDGFDEIIENNRATVNVCVAPSDPGNIAGPVSVCVNSSGNTYSITPIDGARSYNWTVPTGWTITNGQNSATITVTAGNSGGFITVTAENVCAVSAVSRKEIQASRLLPPMPGPITANPATTNVCANQTGFTYTIAPVTDAASYTWSVPAGWTITAGQGTTTITVTSGATGGNIAVAAVNGCGSSQPRTLPVTTSTMPPAQPAAITGNSGPCIGVSTSYSVAPISGVNSYSWTVPTGWTITNGQGTNTIIVISGSNAGNITVTAANGCGISTATNLPVNPITNTAPANISGPNNPCNASSGNSYSVEAVAGAASYTWTVPNGWTITEGQGTTNIKVTAGSNAGNVTVTAFNDCGPSATKSLAVTPTNKPEAPGEITGTTSQPCASQSSLTYSIAAVAGATSYTWSVPSGWSITGGQGTTSITVTAGTTAGNISVAAVNSCGSTQPRTYAVFPSTTSPAQPASITGNSAPCIGVSATYSVSATSGVNSYTWTVPAGWTITGGQGTANITVTTGNNAGNITVTAANGCGTSTAANLAVSPITNTAPGNISGVTAPCATSTGNTYHVEAVAGATSYTWTVPNGWTITNGQGTTNIMVTAGNNPGSVTVTAFNDCGPSATKSLTVSPTNKPEAPGDITGTTSQPCVSQNSLTYSIAAVAGATSYNWSVPSGWSITGGQGTTSITVTAGANAGDISVAAVNSCGVGIAANLAVTPSTTVPTEPISIIGKENPCVSETNVTYSVNPVTGATGYTWTVPTGWSIIGGQGTASITVTTGSIPGEIAVTAINNCGSSTAKALSVVASTAPSPAPGTITSSQLQPCSGETNITYSVAAVNRATSYAWTVPAGWVINSGQGTTAISVTAGETPGKVTVKAVNGCGTSAPSELNVTPLLSVPLEPITITGTFIPCAGQNNLTYSIAAVANANGYTWTVPAGWSITAGQGTTSITAMAGTQPGEIAVTARNNCGSSSAKIQAVNVSTVAPVTPGAITGNTNLCAGQNGITYSVLPVAGANSYIWTVPNGWNITAGQGTNAIVVSAGSTAGVISVKTTNNCGTSTAREVSVSPTTKAPSNPGVISASNTTICAGQTNIIYSVTPVAGATTYNWSVPSGWNITSGQGTNSITVTAGATGGTISLTAYNNCGASPAAILAVTPGTLPAPPVAITGGIAPCSGSTGNTFRIAAVPGATSYVWTVPTGWAITAGAGTTNITVRAGEGKGVITVAAINNCGTSATVSINVGAATAVPGLPGTITGSGSVCADVADLTYTINPVENASNYIWSVPAGWVITGGQGTTMLTVTASNSPGTISVIAENGCGFSTASILPVAVTGSAPPVPLAIKGTTKVCANQNEIEYSIGGVNGATTYTWTVPADWEIISGQGTTAIKVKTGTTSGSVRVAAGNGCGASTAQALAVNITNAPEQPLTISGILNQCAGNTGSKYKIDAIPDATSYTWTVPTDWKITAGQGTTTITVTAGKESGNISVTAVNGCGSSKASTVVVTSATTPTPAPGQIRTSQVLACIGQENITYTIEPIANANSYNWAVPADWTITAGQGTTSITVIAGSKAGSVSVKAVNGCGESDASSISVNPGQTPAVEVGVVTGEPMVCTGTKNLIYTIEPVPGAITYTWEVPAGWAITNGQNTNTITVTAGSTSGLISVTAASTCATSYPSKLEVKVNPAPQALGAIKETSTSCTGLSYSVAAVNGATGYTWEVPTGWTIASGQGTNNITVTAPENSSKGIIKVSSVTASCTSEPVSFEADPSRAKSNLTIANVFSPNNDGTNDKWEIPNILNFPDNDLVIINRWGNEVYRSKSYQNNWDGGSLSAGTYFYVLNVKECDGNYKTYKGYVMMMR
ncbi:ice-binding family protein [Adhaeribacter rhizoryzae]|uniref:DUF3494 domain-containing protein n=1 Tax=Adhaeribacter rhizoryzae TaxID=2607907 RepID=A0A5M6DRY3_9BACT|nr:ice-binding family protein [Adhaeribacter rhizoryzae]KAA5549086.1 DUF3494 domain-containing protein [Adhaeribacter rhizoryzae]